MLIKDCPWCQEQPKIELEKTMGVFHISCQNMKCPVMPITGWEYKEKTKAIESWNKTCVIFALLFDESEL